MKTRNVIFVIGVFQWFFQCAFQYAIAADIKVAVAANFSKTMRVLVTEFEKNSKHRVKVSYGSSGKLAAQIQQGAPFEIFLSADQHKVNVLIEKGLTVPNSQYTYALGELILWAGNGKSENNGLKYLKSGNFNKLAIANPNHAPYGVAAIQVLKSLKLEQVTQSKKVFGENISQTYQFVSSGNAEIGFVALSQIRNNANVREGSVWHVPKDLYQPIRQDIVLLKRGQNNQAATELWKFIKSPLARMTIESYGYKTVDNTSALALPKR